jgi:hypothetical protein
MVRQKASIAILEWLEGNPRELQIQMSGKPDDFADMLRRFRDYPEFQRGVTDESLKKVVLGQEIPPALPDAAREEAEQAG